MTRSLMTFALLLAIAGGLTVTAQDAPKKDAKKEETKKEETKQPEVPKEPEAPKGPFIRSYHNALPFASDLKMTKEQATKVSDIRKDYETKIAKLILEEREKLEAVLTVEQKGSNQKLESDYLQGLAKKAADRKKFEEDAAKAKPGDGPKLP